jgi:hypothetical protein
MKYLARDFYYEFRFGYWGRLTEKFLKKLDYTDVHKCCEKFFSNTNCTILKNAKAKFTPEFIFKSFLEGKKIFEILSPPINPYQYKKMLDEFNRFGDLFYFPKELVDKWFDEIVNKYVFCITSSIMTFKFSYAFSDFLDNTLLPFFNGTNLKLQKADDWTCDVFFKKDTFLSDLNLPEDTDAHKTLDYLKQILWLKGFAYKRPNYKGSFLLDMTSGIGIRETDEHYILTSKFNFLLDDIGFIEWVKSITTEHIGIAQLFYLISEVKDNMTLGEKIIWINRAMDVVHYFSDLASFFIVGVQKCLDNISNGNVILINCETKKINERRGS